MNMDVPDMISRIAAFFFPERCVLCGAVVAYDDMWCGKCAFERVGIIQTATAAYAVTEALAAAGYAGAARDAVLRVKDKDDKRVFLFFAGIMAETIEACWHGIKFDALVPVPADPPDFARKGFNHAQRLAARLSALIDAPVCEDALIKREGGKKQRTLGAEERLQNARQVYAAGNTEPVKDRIVLLVDDVFTTGATVSVCAQRLIEAGARRVYAATAAYTRLETGD
jgi:ComF family protein